MPLRALLFDFDGVIADTENIHIVAWERTFGLMGWTVEPDVCARAASVDDRAFLREVFADRGIEDGDVAGWVSRKQQFTVAMLADAPRVYPGIPELVREVHRRGRVRQAVVSTTWRENVEVVLKAVGLADAFEFIIGKEDVKETKPDPTGYKKALRRLGLKPREALALEDSPMGHLSAQLAGVRPVVVGHQRLPAGWVGPALYLSDFSDTAEVIATLEMMAPSGPP